MPIKLRLEYEGEENETLEASFASYAGGYDVQPVTAEDTATGRRLDFRSHEDPPLPPVITFKVNRQGINKIRAVLEPFLSPLGYSYINATWDSGTRITTITYEKVSP